jgi:hypothetical protein
MEELNDWNYTYISSRQQRASEKAATGGGLSLILGLQ